MRKHKLDKARPTAALILRQSRKGEKAFLYLPLSYSDPLALYPESLSNKPLPPRKGLALSGFGLREASKPPVNRILGSKAPSDSAKRVAAA